MVTQHGWQTITFFLGLVTVPNPRGSLTPKEWNEIKDCTDALFAVVGIFKELPNRAEGGGIEALESVQRRLSLTVTSAANRLEGARWECPLCGNTAPPPDHSETPPDPSDDQCTLCGQSMSEEPKHQSVVQ